MAFFRTSLYSMQLQFYGCNCKNSFFSFARSILKSQHRFHEVFIYYTCAMAIIGSVKGYCAKKKPSYLLFFSLVFENEKYFMERFKVHL